MANQCLESSDSLRFICGEFIIKTQRKEPTPLIKKADHLYFGVKVGDEDKTH